MPDPAGYLEAWLICGRRSGKSFILALIAAYLAVFRDWRVHLAPGEAATIMVLASDRKQAGARLTAQLCALERKAGRTGKDLISHPPTLHDDIVNAVAGLFGDRPPPGVFITDAMVEAARRLSAPRQW